MILHHDDAQPRVTKVMKQAIFNFRRKLCRIPYSILIFACTIDTKWSKSWK